MSKIGQKPVIVPGSVQLTIVQNKIDVKGPIGSLSILLPKELSISQTEGQLVCKRHDERKKTKALHGLFRSLVANAVAGVEKPWEKKLDVVGTGFNVKLQGEDLVFKVGYSHSVVFKKVSGTVFKVEGTNKVVVAGADKQLVGQVAYQIKLIRKPDVYKGKGIRFENEVIKLKPGKKAKTATA